MIKLEKLKYFLLFSISFLGFIGYFFILTLFINGLGNSRPKYFSLGPILGFNICLLGIFILFRKKKRSGLNYTLFCLFSIMYLIRIFLETVNNRPYYTSHWQVFVMFVLYMVMPFTIIVKTKFQLKYFEPIRKAILWGALLFGLVILFYYGKLIGHVGRIGTSTDSGINALNPLSFSYCGALAIGVGISYLLKNSMSIKNRTFILAVIGLSVIPFFLGSSRGSFIALLLTFIILPLLYKRASSRISLLLFGSAIIFAIVFISISYHSNLMTRITGTQDAIEQSSSSASRLILWKDSFNQFTDHPFIGSQLGLKDFAYYYPHNIFFEALLTTGLLGFIPLFWLMVNGFKKAIRIFQNSPQYGWLSIIFIQSFVQSMFSSAIFDALWLWLSLSLVLAFPLPAKLRTVRKMKINKESIVV
ncbi:MAG: O-antigen ligase family protein [Ginsengibacter sp.]